jgi:multicomponent Na+:H+ antiporter subunit E
VTLLALHMMLAILWAMATGSLNLPSLLLGFIIAGGVLHFAGPALGNPRYAVRAFRVLGLGLYFLRELLVSSVRVAIDVLRPTLTMTPAVIAVPIELGDDAQITLLANLISLTPGTLSIDVAADGSTLYVHAMYGEEPELVRQHIKHEYERRIQEVFR